MEVPSSHPPTRTVGAPVVSDREYKCQGLGVKNSCLGTRIPDRSNGYSVGL